MRILSIDPGGTTGIAWCDFVPGKLNTPGTSMPQGFGQASEFFSMYIEEFRPELIVIEKFTINARTIKSSREGSNLAIELTGVAKFLAKRSNITVEEQSPADAKNFASDDKLRRIGWYQPGPDHARDAMRHLLLAAVRNQVLDLSILVSSAGYLIH